MKPFHYGIESLDLEQDSDFVATVRKGLSSRADLLLELAEVLELPDYFGENWDALSDCLRDLSWIDERRIVLIHEDVPRIGNDELSTYVDVLKESVNDWAKCGRHELIVVFPEGTEDDVQRR